MTQEYRRHEWIAAISGDFFADKRFEIWRDRYSEAMEGCFGTWRWLIGAALVCAEITKDIDFRSIELQFYDLLENVIDYLYASNPRDDNEASLRSLIVPLLK